MPIAHRTLQVILHPQNEETLDHADVAAGYFMSMGLLMAYAFTAAEAILQAQQVVMTTTMTTMKMKTTTTKMRRKPMAFHRWNKYRIVTKATFPVTHRLGMPSWTFQPR